MKINLDRTQERIEKMLEQCRIENKKRNEKAQKDKNSSKGKKGTDD